MKIPHIFNSPVFNSALPVEIVQNDSSVETSTRRIYMKRKKKRSSYPQWCGNVTLSCSPWRWALRGGHGAHDAVTLFI
ncbi:hypothetical protein OUZ56_000858 [Daphnia magna]|uniref:Uncharacterized protein n=1 Tax=Daphnia magna TaxID=35525 RepID=A0ABR0A0Y9_9CRUS|nr:hypothetical protein OUZ56_000858 [Daphnia magna]